MKKPPGKKISTPLANLPVRPVAVRQRGRRPGATGRAKGELMQVRLETAEKQAFADAAALDGKDLSEWVRDRLRRLSRQELEAAGQTVAFLAGIPLPDS